MPQVEIVPIEDWATFEGVANRFQDSERLSPTNFAYAFRGHEDADYRIEPTLHRTVKQSRDGCLPPAGELIEIERHVTARFKAAAFTLLPAPLYEVSKATASAWCLMRHYGVPTRVVDWTTSLYVAAYFACSRQPARPGAIYAIGVNELNAHMDASHKDGTQRLNPESAYLEQDALPIVSLVTTGGPKIDRMLAQQGVFMVCRNVAQDLQEALAAVPRAGQRAGSMSSLIRFAITASAKPKIMRRLFATNVTAQSLFPGVDGIGRHLEELVRYCP